MKSLSKIYLCKLRFLTEILNCDTLDRISEGEMEVMLEPLLRGRHEVDKDILKVTPIERLRSAVDQLG